MSNKHRSIGQRLDKARLNETRLEITLEWVEDWTTEHNRLITVLERAVMNNDYDLLCIVTGQLKAMSAKKLSALPKVFIKVSDIKVQTNDRF